MIKECNVCGFDKIFPIFVDRKQPLGALGLPERREEAIAAKKLPIDFYSCARCSHIFNVSFSYDDVPYSDGSNLMYNAGAVWNEYIEELIARVNRNRSLANSTIVEIGCGNGIFLQKIKSKFSGSRCVGFDPSVDASSLEGNIEGIKDYFIPERDLQKYKPDILVCRHVVEHLEEPTKFMSEIAYWCSYYDIRPLFIVEVPRMNVAIEQRRVADFIYEHVSNFTDRSFEFMIKHSGFELLEMRSEYGDEVIVSFLRAPEANELRAIEQNAKKYFDGIASEVEHIRNFLEHIDGANVAFWGGTGKGATFLNAFDITSERFPVVVDSDERKCGFYVPGMGQEIIHASTLCKKPVDNIVITTSWRAEDIYKQAVEMGIQFKNIYYVKNNKLVNCNF